MSYEMHMIHDTSEYIFTSTVCSRTNRNDPIEFSIFSTTLSRAKNLCASEVCPEPQNRILFWENKMAQFQQKYIIVYVGYYR